MGHRMHWMGRVALGSSDALDFGGQGYSSGHSWRKKKRSAVASLSREDPRPEKYINEVVRYEELVEVLVSFPRTAVF